MKSSQLSISVQGYDNEVFRTGKQEGKPLSFKTTEAMRPGDKDKADAGENRGLRVSCGATGVKSFFYRYTSPVTSKLAQVKIGNFPQTSLAAACLKLNELKRLKRERSEFCVTLKILQRHHVIQSPVKING